MSAAFVVDCSVAMAWLFDDEATTKTAALLNRLATETALVPDWWFIEITNVLASRKQGRITATQSDAFIADLGKLGIERGAEAPESAFTQLPALCRTHRLTSYDAIYLELAIRRSLPLATLDDDLRKPQGNGVSPSWVRGPFLSDLELSTQTPFATGKSRRIEGLWCREGELNPQGTKYRRILRE